MDPGCENFNMGTFLGVAGAGAAVTIAGAIMAFKRDEAHIVVTPTFSGFQRGSRLAGMDDRQRRFDAGLAGAVRF